MRKFSGVLLAAAMLLPVGLMAAPSGAAATPGTTCKPPSGVVTLKPGLTAKPTVQTITINLPITGCVGGGVKSGTFKGSLKTTAITTASFAKSSAPLKLASVVTWNTKATSTLTANSTTKIAKTIVSTVKGKITKGLFLGKTFTSVQTVTLGTPSKTGAITTLKIKGSAAVTIK